MRKRADGSIAERGKKKEEGRNGRVKRERKNLPWKHSLSDVVLLVVPFHRSATTQEGPRLFLLFLAGEKRVEILISCW